MDNQHKLIKGYRDLTHTEIDLMNRIKKNEETTMELVKEVKGILRVQEEMARQEGDDGTLHRHSIAEPQRWCAMAKSQLQVGFMQLVRAVAQPQSPNGNLEQ